MSRMGEIAAAIDDVLGSLNVHFGPGKIAMIAAIGPSDEMLRMAHKWLAPDRYDDKALGALFTREAERIVDSWQTEPIDLETGCCTICGMNHNGEWEDD